MVIAMGDGSGTCDEDVEFCQRTSPIETESFFWSEGGATATAEGGVACDSDDELLSSLKRVYVGVGQPLLAGGAHEVLSLAINEYAR